MLNCLDESLRAYPCVCTTFAFSCMKDAAQRSVWGLARGRACITPTTEYYLLPPPAPGKLCAPRFCPRLNFTFPPHGHHLLIMRECVHVWLFCLLRHSTTFSRFRCNDFSKRVNFSAILTVLCGYRLYNI